MAPLSVCLSSLLVVLKFWLAELNSSAKLMSTPSLFGGVLNYLFMPFLRFSSLDVLYCSPLTDRASR